MTLDPGSLNREMPYAAGIARIQDKTMALTAITTEFMDETKMEYFPVSCWIYPLKSIFCAISVMGLLKISASLFRELTTIQ